MKKSIKYSLAFVLFFCTVVAANANIINSGFETGSLSPWYEGREGLWGIYEHWNVTSAEHHSGDYSATDIGNIEIRQDFAAIPTDQILELSFWLKQPNSVISVFSFYYSDGTSYDSAAIYPLETWTPFDVTSFLSPAKNLVGFGVFGYSTTYGDARTYLDDVVLRTAAVPEPTTMILLGLGLIGLAGVRRKV
jgi:hypothetical protein